MDIKVEFIYPAMDEISDNLLRKEEFQKSPETLLFGPESVLDSLAFVSFIIAIEEQIFQKTGKQVSLVDERAMSQRNSPFRTVESLSKYISELI